VSDVVIDNCSPPGDCVVELEGLAWRTGPTSTVSGGMIINMLRCRVAELLMQRGIEPVLLPSHQFVDNTSAAEQLERFYEAYRRSLAHLYRARQCRRRRQRQEASLHHLRHRGQARSDGRGAAQVRRGRQGARRHRAVQLGPGAGRGVIGAPPSCRRGWWPACAAPRAPTAATTGRSSRRRRG